MIYYRTVVLSPVVSFAAAQPMRRAFGQLPILSPAQRRLGVQVAIASFLGMGIAGETLPVASWGRVVPVEWWSYVTLALSPVLIGLIAATYVTSGHARSSGRKGKLAAGAGALIGTTALACPVCSPLAIPLFGAAGILSFLAPARGLIALLSIGLLAFTLALRVRGMRSCEVAHAARAGHERRASIRRTA